MTEHETFPGKPYVVTSKAGCTITDASGELEETCEPGKQKVVHAPSEKLFTSAPAIVRETFNRAASALGLLGGGVDKWGKYAKCTTNEEMAAINADYRNDVDENGVWAYNLPNMKNFTVRYGGDYKTSGLCTGTAKKVKLVLDKVKSVDSICRDMPNLEEAVLIAPKADYYGIYTFSSCRKLKKAHVEVHAILYMSGFLSDCPELEEVSGVCGASDGYPVGGSKLRHWRLELPKLKTAVSGLCASAQLTKDSALFLLNTIPDWADGASHIISLGIHVDHQTDEDIINAIAEAEAKGWTLTVRWNGTPGTSTASTFALRRRPVWAKLGEPMEDGSPALDWGHYVTTAEENGYTEFASLEEAKEHFNITEDV